MKNRKTGRSTGNDIVSKQILLLRKQGQACVPAYKGDAEALSALKDGALILSSDRTPPSAKLRRFYWALLHKVVDNHEFYYDADQLNQVIKYGLGYFDITVDHDMNIIKSLRSNSSLERSFDEYKTFCDRAFDFVVAHIAPGSKKELINAVEEMLGLTLNDCLKGNRGKDCGELYDEQG